MAGVPSPLLLLSATEFEVEPLAGDFTTAAEVTAALPSGWRARRGTLESVPTVAVATGVGKVNAAALTALAVTALKPRALLLVGIGGAYSGAGLALGEAVLAESETHVDTGVGHGATWLGLKSIGFPLLPAVGSRSAALYNQLPLAPGTTALAAQLGVKAVPFGTSEAVTADAATASLLRSLHGVAVESMEGAAVAQVAAALQVPLYQVRGVSNLVGDRDKTNWRINDAVAASCRTARAAIPLLTEA